MTEETTRNNDRPEWDKEHDLYIGVKNDLSPFTVDLKALTRGLVVVGQSGCGKSFMLGRIVEEIVRKTHDSRILIIDPNSDFCNALEIKEVNDFKEDIDKYFSGVLCKEFKDFEKREFDLFSELSSIYEINSSQIFGRLEGYNLSWDYLIKNELFNEIVKAWDINCRYILAKSIVFKIISDYVERTKEIITLNKLHDFTLNIFLYLYKTGDPQYLSKEDIEYLSKMTDFRIELDQFHKDISFELKSRIWSENEDSEFCIPYKMFKECRINIADLSQECIKYPDSKLKIVVLFVNLWVKVRQIKFTHAMH